MIRVSLGATRKGSPYQLLSHASMVTTAKYAHLAPGRLMQAASEAAAHYQIQTNVPALPAPAVELDEG